MGANEKVGATFHGEHPLAPVKRLAHSLVVLAAAREAAGWQRIATLDEIGEISTALTEAHKALDLNAIKTAAIRELAEAQRQLARDARTDVGRAEHEDRADWLDDRANLIDPRRLEGAHP